MTGTSGIDVAILGAGGHARDLLSCFKTLPATIDKGAEPDPNAWLVHGMKDAALRRMLTAKYGRERFCEARHATAIVDILARRGHAGQFMACVIVQPFVALGDFVILNIGSRISHECVLGDYVFCGPGATLTGNVKVGNDAMIGACAVVLPGRSIGAGAIVGAGAVVTRDVPPFAIVAGNPARFLRHVSNVEQDGLPSARGPLRD